MKKYNEKVINMLMMKLLLVEDDNDIATSLQYFLNNNGYNVDIALTYQEAKLKIYQNTYDFYILDIALPDGKGTDLFNKFIKELKKPTIFLTANDSEETIVDSLESGAEDYITKPFSPRELLVRIKKISARFKKDNLIKIQDLTFDIDKMILYKNNKIINLTSLELRIFNLLINNLNKVVTRNTIIESIWEWTGNDVNDNTVTVYLKRIREKIACDCIITIKGIGYRIDADEK